MKKVKVMEEKDIRKVIPLYMEYYNLEEQGAWTEEITYKRIHQVWSREDSLCTVLLEEDIPLGFAMGYFEQYDDLKAYDLVEIVIARQCQNKGIGTWLMIQLEKAVKEAGGAMVQLQAVNDELHERFYGRLGYKDAESLVIKTKWL